MLLHFHIKKAGSQTGSLVVGDAMKLTFGADEPHPLNVIPPIKATLPPTNLS